MKHTSLLKINFIKKIYYLLFILPALFFLSLTNSICFAGAKDTYNYIHYYTDTTTGQEEEKTYQVLPSEKASENKDTENYICSICFNILNTPTVYCENEGDTFCRKCCEQNGRNPCPSCRDQQNPTQITDFSAKQTINRFSVYCPDCHIKLTIENIPSHQKMCVGTICALCHQNIPSCKYTSHFQEHMDADPNQNSPFIAAVNFLIQRCESLEIGLVSQNKKINQLLMKPRISGNHFPEEDMLTTLTPESKNQKKEDEFNEKNKDLLNDIKHTFNKNIAHSTPIDMECFLRNVSNYFDISDAQVCEIRNNRTNFFTFLHQERKTHMLLTEKDGFLKAVSSANQWLSDRLVYSINQLQE
ncbi:hypothetical protein CI610_01556 [invertebrate metagenome]|uniref:RING-type domain-containing protein n=1 Tax=invertebrate metagenome TaxID=1711999 RepID=A0A2H9T8E5_9ZZZZ